MLYTIAALFILALSPASSLPELSDPHLRVHVYNRAGLTDALVKFAEAESSRLLNPSIPIEWLNCKASLTGQCDQYFWTGDVSVTIVPHVRSGMTPDALGFAFLAYSDSYAMIPFDRLAALRAQDVAPYSILGKVMAHEITHLLLGASHASTGVMRPFWSKEDLRVTQNAGWFYTPQQMSAMHGSMEKRLLQSDKYLSELM